MLKEQSKARIAKRDNLIEALNVGKGYINPRKIRTDKGMCRAKYASNLPKKYISIVNRANQKGLEFTLSVDDFNQIVINPCVFCGTSNNVAIDRIDSYAGYTPDNCQPCCGVCNNMKMLLTNEAFIKQINRIYKQINSLR